MIESTTDACYGTEEYYCELFADILADCATGRSDEDRKTIRNVMAGFERAICKWMDYHEDSVAKYRELHRRFIVGDLSYDDDW